LSHSVRCVLVMIVCISTGCDVELRSADSKNRLTGGGIVFEIPMENSDAQTGPNGIRYKSDRLAAMTDGSELWVNGVYYGPLHSGDIVDFYGYPEIRVNGTLRDASPSKSPDNPKQ